MGDLEFHCTYTKYEYCVIIKYVNLIYDVTIAVLMFKVILYICVKLCVIKK